MVTIMQYITVVQIKRATVVTYLIKNLNHVLRKGPTNNSSNFFEEKFGKTIHDCSVKRGINRQGCDMRLLALSFWFEKTYFFFLTTNLFSYGLFTSMV